MNWPRALVGRANWPRSLFRRVNWPRTLFGRVVLVLVAGLALAQLVTLALVLAERGMVMRGMMASYLAADVASSVAILDRVPVAERAAWLPRLQRANYRLSLGAAASAQPAADTALATSLRQAVAQALSQPVQAVRPLNRPGVEVRLVTRLQDGADVWVDVAQPRLRLSPWLLAALAAQLAILAACAWAAVRQVTGPLTRLTRAAQALAPGHASAPLPETGPAEVAHASAAFNRMQGRIDAQLEERSQMLGAIAHDLQTPITRMRLRAELLDDAPLQAKLQADLGQMQHLVEQGLAYARAAQADQEALVRVDLPALLHSVVADAQDAAQPVQWRGGPAAQVLTRPGALRRMVVNLVDNAVKFGGAAEVWLEARPDAFTILVGDRGPGIPADELAKVTAPFYRIEASRSRATGGTGLGLAIVQRLAPLCGAALVLSGREGGGLLASLSWRQVAAAPIAGGSGPVPPATPLG